MARLYAGLDVGTTRVKLVVFDDSFSEVERKVLPSPLRVSGWSAWHDSHELLSIVWRLGERAASMGVRALGVSLYRASPAAWRPGGEPLSHIVLWLDRHAREESVRMLPPAARLAARLPVVGRAFSPASPLPTISTLLRKYGGRSWTVDALIAERAGSSYVTVAGMASLSGAFHPTALRKLGFLARIAGVPEDLIPGIVGEAEVEGRVGGARLASISADQQAALIGLGCLGGGCVKLSLGTGGFATSASPARGDGVQPLAILLHDGRRYVGWETMLPGLGIAVENMALLAGGFGALKELAGQRCLEDWSGELLVLASSPHSTPGGHLPVLIAPPMPLGRGWAACGIITGLGLAAAGLLKPHMRMARRVLAVGGLTRLRAALEVAASAINRPIESYPQLEASARGAAFLAALGVGDVEISDAAMLEPDPGEGEIHDPHETSLNLEELASIPGGLTASGILQRVRAGLGPATVKGPS
ncbi:MAG: hypothetical protein F7B20_03815 [Aeropyrum sp.]|nr:hypothetical protein [Aeropyrum sp.]